MTDADRFPQLRADLREASRRLRETDHLDPEERARLAALIDELGDALDPQTPPEASARLANEATALVDALHEQHDEGLLAHARDRLRDAAAHAEADAPFATGVARRFLDLLAQIGI